MRQLAIALVHRPVLDKEQKIARPRQIYVGAGERQYGNTLENKFPRARKDSIRK